MPAEDSAGEYFFSFSLYLCIINWKIVLDKSTKSSGHIGGISLASFLQMLEQERKNCTLIVKSGEQVGELFFDDGKLIDAQYDEQVGLEAAYALLAWEDPTFVVEKPDDRLQRISAPLAQILLEAAAQQDENESADVTDENMRDSANMAVAAAIKKNPGIKQLVDTILSIAGVKHYFIMNRKGVMIAQSSRNRSMGDFIRYCIVSGSRLRKELDVRGPHQIRLFMENGEKLLVIPGNGIIVALLVNEHISIFEVTEKLQKVLIK